MRRLYSHPTGLSLTHLNIEKTLQCDPKPEMKKKKRKGTKQSVNNTIYDHMYVYTYINYVTITVSTCMYPSFNICIISPFFHV